MELAPNSKVITFSVSHLLSTEIVVIVKKPVLNFWWKYLFCALKLPTNCIQHTGRKPGKLTPNLK